MKTKANKVGIITLEITAATPRTTSSTFAPYMLFNMAAQR